MTQSSINFKQELEQAKKTGAVEDIWETTYSEKKLLFESYTVGGGEEVTLLAFFSYDSKYILFKMGFRDRYDRESLSKNKEFEGYGYKTFDKKALPTLWKLYAGSGSASLDYQKEIEKYLVKTYGDFPDADSNSKEEKEEKEKCSLCSSSGKMLYDLRRHSGCFIEELEETAIYPHLAICEKCAKSLNLEASQELEPNLSAYQLFNYKEVKVNKTDKFICVGDKITSFSSPSKVKGVGEILALYTMEEYEDFLLSKNNFPSSLACQHCQKSLCIPRAKIGSAYFDQDDQDKFFIQEAFESLKRINPKAEDLFNLNDKGCTHVQEGICAFINKKEDKKTFYLVGPKYIPEYDDLFTCFYCFEKNDYSHRYGDRFAYGDAIEAKTVQKFEI